MFNLYIYMMLKLQSSNQSFLLLNLYQFYDYLINFLDIINLYDNQVLIQNN